MARYQKLYHKKHEDALERFCLRWTILRSSLENMKRKFPKTESKITISSDLALVVSTYKANTWSGCAILTLMRDQSTDINKTLLKSLEGT